MKNHELSPPNVSRKPGFFYGYIVVVAAFCIMGVIWGTYYAFGVFFKPMLTEFGWTRAMTAGAFSLASFTRGLLGIITGRLNDKLGPRMVISACGVLLGLGYIVMSQVNAIWQLYLFYGIIIGIGMSGAWVPPLSTIARWFSKRRSTMTGIVLAATGIGTLVAPPVANQLISILDWRTSYIILGIFLLVVVLLAAQFMRRDPAQMGLEPYGKNEVVKQDLNQGAGEFSLSEAIRTRQLWMVSVMSFCRGFAAIAILVHIVPHVTDLGFSASSAANILATIGGLTIVGRIVLGGVADRIGNRQALIIGFILTAAALFWLVPATELWRLYLFAAVFGFANGGIGALGSPLIASLFGLGSHGVILGVASFCYATGAGIGPFLAGYVFDLTGKYQVAFLVMAAVGIAGLLLSVFLRPVKRKQ